MKRTSGLFLRVAVIGLVSLTATLFAEQLCISGTVTAVDPTPIPPPSPRMPYHIPAPAQTLKIGDDFRLTVSVQPGSQSCSTDACFGDIRLEAQVGRKHFLPLKGYQQPRGLMISSQRQPDAKQPYLSRVNIAGGMFDPVGRSTLNVILTIGNYPINLIEGSRLPAAIPFPTPALMPRGTSVSLTGADGYGVYEISFTGQDCAGKACAAPLSAILPVTPHHQEATSWCWAAVGEMVMKFLRPSMNITQCLQADQAFTLTECCQLPRSAECNKPWHVLLRENGFAFTKSTGPLEFERLKEEIGCIKRPIIVYWKHRWSETAHFVLAIGYNSQKEGMQQVLAIDPESGNDDEHVYQWIPYQSSDEPLRRQFVGSWFESDTFDIYAITDTK